MISIICGVKNRENALKLSLTSWLMFDSVSEIIIIDWSSDNYLEYLTSLDKRIKVIRVDNKEYFNLPVSYNLASDFVSNEYILKMDSEYVLNPYYDFVEEMLPEIGTFITGCYWMDSSPFFKYLNGLLYTRTEDFRNVGGYNENLKDYGYDDDDLYGRLEKYGLKRKNIPTEPRMIFHIPHPDNTRVEHYINKDQHHSHSLNKKISKKKIENTRLFKWEIEKIDEQYYKAKDIRIDS